MDTNLLQIEQMERSCDIHQEEVNHRGEGVEDKWLLMWASSLKTLLNVTSLVLQQGNGHGCISMSFGFDNICLYKCS